MLLSPSVARAELVTPQFTQGSMNSTTTTQQEIVEDITITTYGSVLNKWSGDNITHTSASSGGIVDSDSVFTGALATFGLATGNSKDKGNNTPVNCPMVKKKEE